MSLSRLWQRETLEVLHRLLEQDSDVVSLILIGSLNQQDDVLDVLSDIDLLLLVEDNAVERFLSPESWLSPLGKVYASARQEGSAFHTLRTFMLDGRRIDTVVMPISSLDTAADSCKQLLAEGSQVLFAKSPRVAGTFTQRQEHCVPPHSAPPQIGNIANDFWFKGMLAAGKAARGDVLVAFHLTFDMLRDILLLAMLLRDKELGTDHHRGGDANGLRNINFPQVPCPYTPESVFSVIRESAALFDKLAGELSSTYVEQRQPLLAWLDRISEDFHA